MESVPGKRRSIQLDSRKNLVLVDLKNFRLHESTMAPTVTVIGRSNNQNLSRSSRGPGELLCISLALLSKF